MQLNESTGIRRTRPLLLITALAVTASSAARAQWPQFGGPNRNFMVDVKGLADTWPEDGPKKIWHRELGDGYAEIAVDGGVLYTMYRTGEDEFAVALDAETGKTIWEHKTPSPFTELMAQFGPGPHTTPAVVGDKVYMIGTNAMLTCHDKKTGKVIWQHDLVKEFGAPIPGRGYGNSPIAYKNTLIVAVDRERKEEGKEGEKKEDAKPAPEGQSLVAFSLADGKVVWKSADHEVSYASPILVNFQGE